MTENEQELKKEIRVENKRSSDNLNQVTVGFSKIVGLNEFLTYQNSSLSLIIYTPNANMADLSIGPGLVARKQRPR